MINAKVDLETNLRIMPDAIMSLIKYVVSMST